MREMLFRGKRVDNGKWVYGYYVKPTHHWHEHGIHDDWIICSAFQNGGFFNVVTRYAVISETVGQFTGLTDKSGEKIFEGDILRGFDYPFKDNENNYNYYAEIVWFENNVAFGLVTHKNPKAKVVGISDGNCDYIEDWNNHQWKIIGNIYDNKELIGE